MRSQDDTPYLTQANFVGQGFDIWGKYDVLTSVITPLFDPSKAKSHKFEFLGQTFELPDYVVGAEDTNVYFTEDTGSSREDFQNSLAINASVNVGYGPFSGQMSAAYGRQFAQSSEYFYSYRNLFSKLATLSLTHNDEYLSDYFIKRIAALPNTVKGNEAAFIDFFDDFGCYYTSSVTLGATLQYYVAVEKSSSLTEDNISASVNVEFKGVFWSGGVSEDTKLTDSWKSYSASRHVNILAQGGDIEYLGQLVNVDPDKPGPETVELYNAWLKSIDTNPAVVDFKLKGIWELCGEKRAVVLEAFHAYGRLMRPNLMIQCWSQVGLLPSVILDGEALVPQNPSLDHGFQMIVLKRNDISAKGVVLNKYYGFQDTRSSSGFQAMYQSMLDDIVKGGYRSNQYVLILASYGMDQNAPPTANIVPTLFSAGAGKRLEYWLTNSDPGSTFTNNAAYILVGIFEAGRRTGVETFTSTWASPVTAASHVLFYKEPGTSLYTLSEGPIPTTTAAN